MSPQAMSMDDAVIDVFMIFIGLKVLCSFS
jgi:hypothetical protein